MTDTFNLDRFVEAQDRCYDAVLRELKAGRKRSHWMWYIFPQARGLGETVFSQRYAISSPEEARAYSAHPVLGRRLKECTQLVLDVEGRTARQIFAHPDDLKFRSCMTLFEALAMEPSIFRAALDKYYGGEPDPLTQSILGGWPVAR